MRSACRAARATDSPRGRRSASYENAARDAVRDFLARQRAAEPEARTLMLLAGVDGLVFDRLVGGGQVTEAVIATPVTAVVRCPEGG